MSANRNVVTLAAEATAALRKIDWAPSSPDGDRGPPEDSPYARAARAILERLREPAAFVSLVGETSSGKSTLANGLFAQPLLAIGAKPTTATTIRIVCKDIDRPKFFAMDRDGTSRELSQPEFRDAERAPPETLARLEVHAAPKDRSMLGLQVVDTPGYNSLNLAHEGILRAFLPESDAIVFAAGYKAGFGQKDEELFECARLATEGDAELPMLLVVNRTPDGCSPADKRVTEIARNATDSLRRAPELVLIANAPLDETKQNLRAPPDTAGLWERVRALVASPARLRAVQSKLVEAMGSVLEEAIDAVDRRMAVAQASADDVADMEATAEILRDSRDRSYAAIDGSMERLRQRLPRVLEHMADGIRSSVDEEVEASNDYLEKDVCRAWIEGHVLPLAVRVHGKAVEDYIAEELNRLQEDLDGIGNAAITGLAHNPRLKGVAARELALNIAKTLTKNIGGRLATFALSGYGGVGGAAAGAGNLAKTLLRRTVGLFGHRLSRGVYAAIGRFFTSGVMRVLGPALGVLIDAGVFLWDAKKWKGKLKGAVDEALVRMKADLMRIFDQDEIPAIRAWNRKVIEERYQDAIREHEANVAARGKQSIDVGALETLRASLVAHRNELRACQEGAL